MPSNPQSCLLVKIFSSQYGPACPPVIIKEKDGSLRPQRRHQHASLLLCTERYTLSNPPAPDGPIYCTKWIVFGCTIYLQMFLWYPPPPPRPSSSPQSLSGFNQLMESAELFGQFMAGVALLKGWASSDESATPCQADGTHSNSKTKTYNSRLWLDVFVSLYKKKKRKENQKSFLQAAPEAFPWGLDETRQENKEQKQKEKALLLHNLRPKRDKLWEVCKQLADG